VAPQLRQRGFACGYASYLDYGNQPFAYNDEAALAARVGYRLSRLRGAHAIKPNFLVEVGQHITETRHIFGVNINQVLMRL